MYREADTEAIRARKRFDDHRSVPEVTTKSMGFGNGAVEQTILTSLLPKRTWRDAVTLPLRVMGEDFVSDKSLHLISKLFVIVTKNGAHGWVPPASSVRE